MYVLQMLHYAINPVFGSLNPLHLLRLWSLQSGSSVLHISVEVHRYSLPFFFNRSIQYSCLFSNKTFVVVVAIEL